MHSVCILLLLSVMQQASSLTSDSIYAEVQKEISSSRSHVGDAVQMTVLEETPGGRKYTKPKTARRDLRAC